MECVTRFSTSIFSWFQLIWAFNKQSDPAVHEALRGARSVVWCSLLTVESDSAVYCMRHSAEPTPWYDAHCGVRLRGGMHTLEFLKKLNTVSQRNHKRIRKCFNLFVRGPDRLESWQNWGQKSRDTLPLMFKSFFSKSSFERRSNHQTRDVDFHDKTIKLLPADCNFLGGFVMK